MEELELVTAQRDRLAAALRAAGVHADLVEQIMWGDVIPQTPAIQPVMVAKDGEQGMSEGK